jgi:hypothetical protein
MSLDNLVSRLGETADRSTFLRRLGGATIGVTFAALGFSPRARATYSYKGCDLCQPPSPSCSNCISTWCWTGRCYMDPDGVVRRYRCCECYQGPNGCASACSYVYVWDQSCQQPELVET